jgi:hypothetical protein
MPAIYTWRTGQRFLSGYGNAHQNAVSYSTLDSHHHSQHLNGSLILLSAQQIIVIITISYFSNFINDYNILCLKKIVVIVVIGNPITSPLFPYIKPLTAGSMSGKGGDVHG